LTPWQKHDRLTLAPTHIFDLGIPQLDYAGVDGFSVRDCWEGKQADKCEPCDRLRISHGMDLSCFDDGDSEHVA
jgi:hypothetical protein